MFKRIRLKLLILFIGLFLLTGCWDKTESDKQSYVIAIGMDKGKHEGSINVSYLILNPEYGTQQQGGGTDTPPIEIISFEASDVISAQSLANTVIAKPITFDILNYLFVSEALAQEESLVRWIYDAAMNVDIRRDIHFIVTKEPVLDYFKYNVPKLEKRQHKYFEYIIQQTQQTSVISESFLNHYLRITENQQNLFISIYSSTKHPSQDVAPEQIEGNFKPDTFRYQGETNNTTFGGAAIFKNGRMIGSLTMEEMQMTGLLNETLNISRILTSLPDPFHKDYHMGLQIQKNKTNKMHIDLAKHPAKITVQIPIRVDVLTNHSMTNYEANEQNRKKLVYYIEQMLTDRANKLIQKSQKEYQGDFFGWSLEARKKFWTIPDFEAFGWLEKYPEMDIKLSFDIKLGHIGSQSNIPISKKGRD